MLKKRQSTFWEWHDQEYFVIIVSSIIFVKLYCKVVSLLVNSGLSD